MATLESRKPGKLLTAWLHTDIAVSECNDVAGDFEEVAITPMQHNLPKNEQIYSIGEGPNSPGLPC